MKRIQRQSTAEMIAESYDLLPGRLAKVLAHVDFFEGDPLAAGLHRFEDADDGRSFRTTAHCVQPCHMLHLPAQRRVTTIVLPPGENRGLYTVVHELGHALDELDGHTWLASPVNDYAKTNRFEAFACAFEAWVFHTDAELFGPTTKLFEWWAS